MTYTLTSKSQVTLPKAIREHLKVAPGDAVTFRVVADGSVRVEPAAAPGAAEADAVAVARQRFAALRGRSGQADRADPAARSGRTDALMALLRGYPEDATDPGFAPPPAP